MLGVSECLSVCLSLSLCGDDLEGTSKEHLLSLPLHTQKASANKYRIIKTKFLVRETEIPLLRESFSEDAQGH